MHDWPLQPGHYSFVANITDPVSNVRHTRVQFPEAWNTIYIYSFQPSKSDSPINDGTTKQAQTF